MICQNSTRRIYIGLCSAVYLKQKNGRNQWHRGQGARGSGVRRPSVLTPVCGSRVCGLPSPTLQGPPRQEATGTSSAAKMHPLICLRSKLAHLQRHALSPAPLPGRPWRRNFDASWAGHTAGPRQMARSAGRSPQLGPLCCSLSV